MKDKLPRFSLLLAVVIGLLIPAIAGLNLQAQELGRGERILQQRGLQIQAVVTPYINSRPFDLSIFAKSNFTGISIIPDDRNIPLSRTLGSAPGMQFGLQLPNGSLNSLELPFLPNLVGLQMSDEQDITDPFELDMAKATLANWRTLYPNTIGFLNQRTGFTVAQLQNYISYVKPDMLMYDWYPFNGTVVGGSPTANFYNFMQIWRQAALGGHDGTGKHPIPYGQYLQTFDYNGVDGSNYILSASQMRLNQFAGWAFGYTYASAFTYLNVVLFNSDASLRQPAFNDMAETNRQSRNLGPALVRLWSTDVRMVMGQHKGGFRNLQNINNSRPSSVPLWNSGAGNDPYLTAVSAENPGNLNNGLRGDVIVSHFRPMQGPDDLYFMIVNGLVDPNGTVADTSQLIHLTFNFAGSGIDKLLRLNRDTGLIEVVPLNHVSGSTYRLDLLLEGGTGDLFKYDNGLPFVIPEPSTIMLIMPATFMLANLWTKARKLQWHAR